MVMGKSPGPAPKSHAWVSICSEKESSWRTWPNVKDRRKVPRVDGAITSCPSTLPVDPERSTSQSSMHSAPATMACTKVATLRPGRACPGRSPRSTSSSAQATRFSRSERVATSARPAPATARSSSKVTARRAGLWDSVCTGKMPFCFGVMWTSASHIFPRQGAFSAYGQLPEELARVRISVDRGLEATKDLGTPLHMTTRRCSLGSSPWTEISTCCPLRSPVLGDTVKPPLPACGS